MSREWRSGQGWVDPDEERRNAEADDGEADEPLTEQELEEIAVAAIKWRQLGVGRAADAIDSLVAEVRRLRALVAQCPKCHGTGEIRELWSNPLTGVEVRLRDCDCTRKEEEASDG